MEINRAVRDVEKKRMKNGKEEEEENIRCEKNKQNYITTNL